ncbi:hypothetical protein AB0H42_19320 [Nocardia sp. NPDC050799]|uniref:hypothetical protein n=1 Tax=Nocardia sp. NPDC050799 TaxID=3154842 RepID=UPI0033EAC77D
MVALVVEALGLLDLVGGEFGAAAASAAAGLGGVLGDGTAHRCGIAIADHTR